MLNKDQRILGYKLSKQILEEEICCISGGTETYHSTLLATSSGEVCADSSTD